MFGNPLEAELALAGGKLAGGKLAGGKLAVGGALVGSVPGGGLLVEFMDTPRSVDGVFASVVTGAASDVKSGSDPESSDGKVAVGSVAEFGPLAGRGNVPMGKGKGEPRVAVGRSRELSWLSNARSLGAFVVEVAPSVGLEEPIEVDWLGTSTDGAARPTRFELSRFELFVGSGGGATRVSAVLIGFMLGFTPGLTPAFTMGFGLELLVGESRSPLRPCGLGVDSISVERRLMIREASNRGGSEVFAGPSNVNGTAGPLYDARTVVLASGELASSSYELVLPEY